MFIDKTRILFLMSRGPNVYGVGKTKGPGRLNFTTPADADIVVIVKGQTSYVSVNGEVTEYTLSVDQDTRGGLAFSLFSGTNKDYGTRCEMSEMVLWQPE